MEQPDPVQAKVRELLILQLGSQILGLCEVSARLHVAEQQIETLTRALDAAQKKVGPE